MLISYTQKIKDHTVKHYNSCSIHKKYFTTFEIKMQYLLVIK